MMKPVQMLDLKTQYHHIKNDIDKAVIECLESTEFINGKKVKEFAENLATYLDVKHVIPCANGTDALQIAMMALDLKEGDEIIIPAFTYVATAEVIALLKLVPVMVDVDASTFNITADLIKPAITNKTKAIVPVHLFGQCCEMEAIIELAKQNNLFVIEDNAQAIGADYFFSNNKKSKTGTIGDIGCSSFFPSKNLGCFGDGGAMFTNDDDLAKKIKMIANHGQEVKYFHKVVGCNSRLDTLQATILNIKLAQLNNYLKARQNAADFYDNELKNIQGLQIPFRSSTSTHVFHQYTLQIKNGKRDALKKYLESKNIPSMIYYPMPLNEQEAYKNISKTIGSLAVSKKLSETVLSLPMHTELNIAQLSFITQTVKDFFSK